MTFQAATATPIDGTDNDPANGGVTDRWCAQCSERVPADDNGRCERCGGFVEGNPGGRRIAQRRRAELRRSMADIEAALPRVLAPGGGLVLKILEGPEAQAIDKRLRTRFAKARPAKPKASRKGTTERYLIAEGYRGAE